MIFPSFFAEVINRPAVILLINCFEAKNRFRYICGNLP